MNADIETQQLKHALADVSYNWNADNLSEIIYRELSRSDRTADPEIIDSACARLMMLEGISLTNENLHLYEEKLLNRILRETLGLPSEI